MAVQHPLPRVHSAGLFRCAPDWRWDTGKTPFYDDDLWFVASGSGAMLTPVGVLELSPGACFILRGGQRYIAAQDPADTLTVYALHFSGSAAALGLYRIVDDPDLVRLLLARSIARWTDRDETGASLWLAACLDELKAQAARGKIARPVRGAAGVGSAAAGAAGVDAANSGRGTAEPAAEDRIEEIIASILDDPAAAPAVAELAELAGLSRQHFARLFGRRTGTGPKEFIVRARMEAAKILLKNSDHPVKRVAALSGYPDEFLFSRTFKRVVGQTPGGFRRSGLAASQSAD